MNQTILLAKSNNYISTKANRTMWIVAGVIYVGLAIFQIYSNHDEDFHLLAWSHLILGIYFGGYAFLALSKKSPYAPKVLITDQSIYLKKTFLKSAKELKWNELSLITYNPYEITFHSSQEKYTFSYNTSSGTSIEIKRAIRSVATDKGIEVIGG